MLKFLLVAIALALGGSGTVSEPGVVAEAADRPAMVAEDQAPSGRFLTATEVRPILDATRNSWIAIREWEGRDLVYVTHVWSWRCGLLQMEVSMNGGPAEVWDLPDCRAETAQPAAILDCDGVPYREFAPGSVQQVTVTPTYDDLTTDTVSFRRQDVLMP